MSKPYNNADNKFTLQQLRLERCRNLCNNLQREGISFIDLYNPDTIITAVNMKINGISLPLPPKGLGVGGSRGVAPCIRRMQVPGPLLKEQHN